MINVVLRPWPLCCLQHSCYDHVVCTSGFSGYRLTLTLQGNNLSSFFKKKNKKESSLILYMDCQVLVVDFCPEEEVTGSIKEKN